MPTRPPPRGSLSDRVRAFGLAFDGRDTRRAELFEIADEIDRADKCMCEAFPNEIREHTPKCPRATACTCARDGFSTHSPFCPKAAKP